jgi:hypothetical protein
MSQRDDYTTELRQDVGEDAIIHDTKDPDEVFVTTKSKMKLKLSKYEKAVRARTNWVQPVILFLTVIPVLLAADFTQTYILTPGQWQFLYAFCALGSVIWFVKHVYNLVKNWGNARIEYVMEELRADNP